MKSKYIFTGLLLAVVFLSFVNQSCKKIKNPYDGVEGKDTLYYDHIETRIFVEFRDSKTGEYISSNQGETLKVNIGGESKDYVVDIIGKQQDVYFPQNGLLSLGILPEIMPSGSSPVRFTIKSSLFEFLPFSKEVIITSPGDYYFTVKLVNFEDPPDGLVVAQQLGVGNLYNGVLYEDVEISTDNQEATMTLKAGTKFLTADSSFLAGRLNIILIYHDLNYNASLSSMQGGVSSSVIDNGTFKDVIFSTGAIADIKITDSDYKEAYFIEDKDIELSLKISDNVVNPATNSPFGEGNQIGLYTYDADTGSWVFQVKNEIVVGYMGQLYVDAETKTLKNYCLANYQNNTCNLSPGFKIEGECESCESVLISGIMRKSSDNTFVDDVMLPVIREEETILSVSTGNVPVDIYWNDTPDSNQCYVNPVVNPTHIQDMCSQSAAITLMLLENSVGSISVNASFEGVCPGDTNYLILPSFGLWIRNFNSSNWQWISMTNGNARLCNLFPGEIYILGTYYNNSWQQWEFIVGEEEDYNFTIDFTDDICRNIFGIL